ncbi:MAG: DUF2783 domain-containing protein [Gemmatimonadota bacterium]
MPDRPGFTDADATYAAIVAAIEAAGDERALAFLSRLVLLLAAEVRDHETIVAMLAKASEDLDRTE